MRFNKSVGIKEVASEAGVSITTVSRVLRGKGEIAQETRTRVEAAAQDLGYRPNLAVRTMQTGKSGIVGILMDVTIDSGFRGTLLCGIHDTLISADYLPVVIWAKAEDPQFSESDQVHRLVDHRVDGLIISGEGVSEAFFQYIDNLSIPVVIIDRWIDGVHRDIVITDNELGGRQAAKHLIDLGHRRITYMSDHGRSIEEDGGRASAFMREVHTHPDAKCTYLQVEQVHGGYRESLGFLGRPDRPTAVFAYSDYIAYQVSRAAEVLGIRVPEDLSLVGFGNVPNIIEMFPTLTTFEQEPRKIGVIASNIVLSRITDDDRKTPAIIKLEPEMVLRGSTAPLSS